MWNYDRQNPAHESIELFKYVFFEYGLRHFVDPNHNENILDRSFDDEHDKLICVFFVREDTSYDIS